MNFRTPESLNLAALSALFLDFFKKKKSIFSIVILKAELV